MKSSSPISRSSSSPTHNGRIRKTSEDKKEKQKIESTLRRLVGSSSSSSQLDVVLAAISYIRELQNQLKEDGENALPEGFEKLFARIKA